MLKGGKDQVQEDDRIIDDGFSSQQQLQQQQLFVEQIREDQAEQNHKEQVKFKIPPPQEIKDRPYSLHPDLQTGWITKLDLVKPVPLIFQSEQFDRLVRQMLRQPQQKVKIVYLGPRYENSYFAWHNKPFKFPYSHLKVPGEIKLTNRPFCGQIECEQLIFDSVFEGGNLDCVMCVGQREYDCFMRVDSNTAGHLQWFNFKVKGWKKLLKYKINICNFQKNKCLFSRGMKPYIYSQKRFKRQRLGWQQQGENVRFERRGSTAARLYEFQMRQSYRLSFEVYTQYDEDELQIAYCIPYTYSRLGEFLQGLATRPDTKQFLKITKLCNSLGGLEIPLLVVHQGLQQAVQQQQGIPKRCVVVAGRAHPGESNGSHMMQGFIQWLCGDSKQALTLRRYIVFKIVPMLNPDGVAIGNYRTGLSGRDFNRQYKMPQKALFPEVYNFKKLVVENKQLFGQRLLMFLDFHGHSTKKNTFMYGPEFQITDKFYYQSRVFPKLVGNATPMFRYYSCIFKINEFKESTARAVLLRRLGIPLSYTVQTSNGFYFDYEQLKDIPFNVALWRETGMRVGWGLFDYVDLLLTADRNKFEKKMVRRREKEVAKKVRQKKKAERLSIFSAMENQKIKHLFLQIKQAQCNKQKDKKSDDELSEGSSDGEGEQDDLAPAQARYLLQMIKGGKCRSVSSWKLPSRSRHSARKITEALHHELPQTAQQISVSQHAGQSEQVFRGRRMINMRRPMASKQRIVSVEEKKVTPAKIVNFSFCSQSPRNKSKQARNKLCMVPRLNFVELVAGKWSEQKNVRKEGGRGKVLMDLSDPHFRKTFAYNMREREEGPIGHVPTRRGRFEHYKYKRLLLNNQGEVVL